MELKKGVYGGEEEERSAKASYVNIPVIFLGYQFNNSIRKFFTFFLHSLCVCVEDIVSILVDID